MLIKESTIPQLELYFKDKNWIAINEKIVQVSKAGEGNMNCVLRIKTNQRSFICKQSSGYVEKYPQIAAPKNRVQTEAAFYQKVTTNTTIKKFMPQFLGIDNENNIMILEDLGEIKDFSSLYDLKNKLTTSEILLLITYLNELHQSFKKEIVNDELANLELRQLNYEHIFMYPFLEDNGLDLNTIQPGLQEVALPYKTDTELKLALEQLGRAYLYSGKHLLHGDFYPGSWFSCKGEIKIIDPEFCYFGYPEFDLGVFIAHLYLTKHGSKAIELVTNNYSEYKNLNPALLNGFIGVEILRRIIGLAQLPLKMELEDKKELLEKAKQLLLSKND